MPSSPFKLLYEIDVLGAEALDSLGQKVQRLGIFAKHSAADIEDFLNELNWQKHGGLSTEEALERIAKGMGNVSAASRRMAQEVKAANEEVSKSAARASAEQQRSANLAFQTNMRIFRQQQAEKKRIQREEEQAERQSERRMLSGMRTASVLSGVRDSRSIDSFFGTMGGGAAIAGVGGALAVGGLYNLVKDAARDAQQLQNVADELGITANQAFKLQAAAKLSGETLGQMTQAAHRLADGLEHPGTEGKRTAEALNQLGVSLNQGMGPALEEVLQKLNAIEDPAKRATMAFQLFERQGPRMLEIAKNLGSVGESLDQNVQAKLVKANKSLEDFGNRMTIVSGQIAAAVVSAMDTTDSWVRATTDITGHWTHESLVDDNRKARDLVASRVQAPRPKLDFSRADAELRNSSKESLEDRAAKAKADWEDENMRLSGMRLAGSATQDQLDAEVKKVHDLRLEYEKLEAAKKSASRDPNRIPDLIESYRGMVNVNASERDPVVVMRERLNKEIREARDAQASVADLNKIRSIGVDDFMNAMRQKEQRADKLTQLQRRIDEEIHGESSNKSQVDITKDIVDPTSPLYQMFNRVPALAPPPEMSAEHIGMLSRTIAAGQTRLNQVSNPDANQGVIARQNLDLRLREVEATRQKAIEDAKALDAETKSADKAKEYASIEKANAEAIRDRYEAQLEYETRLAEIRNQQKQETANFFTGWTNAALSGQPNASSNFLRQFGRDIFSNMVSNAAKNFLPTLNQTFTLQRNPNKAGILGTAEHPNFLGRIFQGTPLGFDPTAGKADPLKAGLETVTSKFSPLITANDQLRTSVDANRIAVTDLTQVLAKGFGLDTSNLPGMSAAGSVAPTGGADHTAKIATQTSTAILGPLKDMMNSGRNLDPMGIWGTLQKVVGGPGGTSGFAGRVTPAPKPEYTETLGTIPPHILAAARTLATNAHVDRTPAPSQEKTTEKPEPLYRTIQFGGDNQPMPEGGYTGREMAPAPPRPVVHQDSGVKPESIAQSIQAVLRHPLVNPAKSTPPPAPSHPAPAKEPAKTAWPTITLGPSLTKDIPKETGTGKKQWPTIELPAYNGPAATPANKVSEPVMATMPDSWGSSTGDLSDSLDNLSLTLGTALPGFAKDRTQPRYEAPPTIDTSSEYMPSDMLRSLGESLAAVPKAPAMPTDTPGTDPAMADVLASVRRNDIGKAAQIQQQQQDPELSAATGIIGALSRLNAGLGKGSQDAASGNTIGTVMGDGSGMEKAGAVLTAGAMAATGIMTAKSGFGRGGARGDIQGVGGVLAAAAPFSGPAAPFLEAGAAITGLISSLFPDPREQRIKAIEKTLANNAYIMPAARNYDFANGSTGGFSTGNGNSLRAGGPNANYNVTLNASALDANGVLNHFKENSELWGNTMLLGMTSGDSSALQSLVGWNASHGGSIPNVWASGAR